MKKILPLAFAALLGLAACDKPEPTPENLDVQGTWVCHQVDDLNGSQQAQMDGTLTFDESDGTLNLNVELLNEGQSAGSVNLVKEFTYTTNRNGGTLTFSDDSYTTFSVENDQMELLAPFVLTGTILHFLRQ